MWEREKTVENQLVERASLFWVFLVPFAPKVFFFKSVVSFSLVVCVFFAFCSMFSLWSLHVASKRNLGSPTVFKVLKKRSFWIEKSASNVERSKRNALESF